MKLMDNPFADIQLLTLVAPMDSSMNVIFAAADRPPQF
jgi:hypothetical protein